MSGTHDHSGHDHHDHSGHQHHGGADDAVGQEHDDTNASAADHRMHEPLTGRALTLNAMSATLHCLTGCAIGEVLGMVIGTALGWSDVATIVLAVVLAFFFGYALTMRPLLRAGLALGAAVRVALAADTFSILVMEIVDNTIMVGIPGAMEAGLASPVFWGSLAVALAIAFVLTVPLNRWMISRGRGHAVVHQYH